MFLILLLLRVETKEKIFQILTNELLQKGNTDTLGTSSLNYLAQHNKQYHMKVLLNSFHLNGHTLEFYLQSLKLEPPYTA